jgi:hypothetical protein
LFGDTHASNHYLIEQPKRLPLAPSEGLTQ